MHIQLNELNYICLFIPLIRWRACICERNEILSSNDEKGKEKKNHNFGQIHLNRFNDVNEMK